ncbi:hypothetical protein C8J56DRAFT_901385 [Mycena floridula]|nr:hypothetical protein C8J56DRAFT_901385 [Mycena floridula]
MASFAQLFPDSIPRVPVVHHLANVPAFLPSIVSVSHPLTSPPPFLRCSLQDLQQRTSRENPWRHAYTTHFVARSFEELLGLPGHSPPVFEALTDIQLDWVASNVDLYIAGLLTGRYREAMDKMNHGFQDCFATDPVFIFPASSHALRRGHFIDYIGSILYELCFPTVFDQYGLLEYMGTSHPSYVPPISSRQPDKNFDIQKHLRRVGDVPQQISCNIPIVESPVNYSDSSLLITLTNSLQGLHVNRWREPSPEVAEWVTSLSSWGSSSHQDPAAWDNFGWEKARILYRVVRVVARRNSPSCLFLLLLLELELYFLPLPFEKMSPSLGYLVREGIFSFTLVPLQRSTPSPDHLRPIKVYLLDVVAARLEDRRLTQARQDFYCRPYKMIHSNGDTNGEVSPFTLMAKDSKKPTIATDDGADFIVETGSPTLLKIFRPETQQEFNKIHSEIAEIAMEAHLDLNRVLSDQEGTKGTVLNEISQSRARPPSSQANGGDDDDDRLILPSHSNKHPNSSVTSVAPQAAEPIAAPELQRRGGIRLFSLKADAEHIYLANYPVETESKRRGRGPDLRRCSANTRALLFAQFHEPVKLEILATDDHYHSASSFVACYLRQTLISADITEKSGDVAEKSAESPVLESKETPENIYVDAMLQLEEPRFIGLAEAQKIFNRVETTDEQKDFIQDRFRDFLTAEAMGLQDELRFLQGAAIEWIKLGSSHDSEATQDVKALKFVQQKLQFTWTLMTSTIEVMTPDVSSSPLPSSSPPGWLYDYPLSSSPVSSPVVSPIKLGDTPSFFADSSPLMRKRRRVDESPSPLSRKRRGALELLPLSPESPDLPHPNSLAFFEYCHGTAAKLE